MLYSFHLSDLLRLFLSRHFRPRLHKKSNENKTGYDFAELFIENTEAAVTRHLLEAQARKTTVALLMVSQVERALHNTCPYMPVRPCSPNDSQMIQEAQ